MALTGEQLTDEIRAIVGRETAGEPLITDARCARWLNEAQKRIARECIDLECLHFKNTDSVDTTQSLRYAINEISVGHKDNTATEVNRIFEIYYLDGNESVELDWMFLDDFDAAYPDPTHSDIAWDKPTNWTRRGTNIEIFPLCACAYCDKDLRFEGDFWPHDLTTNDATSSDISNGDEGLIAYGVWKAWGAIGGQSATIQELKWKKRFLDWLDDFKTENETLYEWDGKMYGDEIE